MIADLINAGFQVGGSAFTWGNVFAVYRDKQLKGVRSAAILFFMVWNGWNLWFYNEVWGVWSYVGGVTLLLANAAWVTLAIYYKRREHETALQPDLGTSAQESGTLRDDSIAAGR